MTSAQKYMKLNRKVELALALSTASMLLWEAGKLYDILAPHGIATFSLLTISAWGTTILGVHWTYQKVCQWP